MRIPGRIGAKKRDFLTRYQAHGSPGNLLDLYDEADIPETESFGTSRFPIPGLRVDPDYSEKQFGTPNPLAMKFASSAADFSGKKLVSSETGTWLANHFKVSLSQVKPQIDELVYSWNKPYFLSRHDLFSGCRNISRVVILCFNQFWSFLTFR